MTFVAFPYAFDEDRDLGHVGCPLLLCLECNPRI